MPQAIPGQTSSTAPSGSRAGGGLLRVVSNAELDAYDADRRRTSEQAKTPTPEDIGWYIRDRWTVFRNHRNQGNDPLNERLLRAQRMFNGQYDNDKLAEIRKFGGSTVYSRLVAWKCRGATAMLRDVYLGVERPWDIMPQPDPPVPPEIRASIEQLVSTEVTTLQQAGAPVIPEQAHMRFLGLMHAATAAAKRNAMSQALATSDKIEDILVAGGFYDALTEFLTDLPLFPVAVIKGPVVRMVPKLSWNGGKPKLEKKAQMFWERVSPFDVYWTPGVSRIADADIIQRKRYTRTDLNDLIGLPGYNEDAIRAVLDDYRGGLREWMDSPDTEQALNEGRENPTLNQSQMIEGIEFHGNIQGRLLLDQGVTKKLIPDLDRDYSVQSWVIGRHTIKTQINPSPRQRHPYFVTSFEKVPGTVSGHALPDILEDLQEVCNATYRSLVNNMAISSGPQVVINDEMLAPTENGDELYPWKRWHIVNDPMSNGSREPITFFQPGSNAQELLGILQAMEVRADEASAIPRYMTGTSASGGAGRTASGLGMLMQNAEKVLQTVAGNIDGDVMNPMLESLYDLIMLTDQSGLLTGEEEIRVRGVNVAIQKETERQKQLQFLQITANPIDGPIIGELGRARVLRAVAQGLGLPDDVVPDDTTLQQQIDAKKQAEQAAMLMQAQAAQMAPQGAPGAPGGPPPGPEGSSPSGPGGSAPDPAFAATAGNQAPTPTPARLSDNAPPVNSFQQQSQGIPT